jgi:hypothetical protein
MDEALRRWCGYREYIDQTRLAGTMQKTFSAKPQRCEGARGDEGLYWQSWASPFGERKRPAHSFESRGINLASWPLGALALNSDWLRLLSLKS